MNPVVDTGVHDLERARLVADAVLYEGYVLFPYHAAATKNRFRWQFGVIVPDRQLPSADSERASIRSQLLVSVGPATQVEVVLRFLHPRRRQVEQRGGDGRSTPVEALEVDGELRTSWEEGVEHEHRLGHHHLAALCEAALTTDIHLAAEAMGEDLRGADGSSVGRLVRTAAPVDLAVTLHADALAPHVVRLTTEIANVTDWCDPDAARAEVVRHGVAGVHLLLQVSGGRFASATDPPAWASPWTETCCNEGTYPVLVGPPGSGGDAEVVLSAPIILYDHPEIAEESPGDAYDATEIHELLTLCTSVLSDEEKRAARATDPRAAAVIDDADHLPPELLARLHGSVRELGPRERGPADDVGGTRPNQPAPEQPLEDELAAFLGVGEDPISSVTIGDVEVGIGGRVRLEPVRRADAQDVFVAGRIGIVGRIVETLDGEVQVGVTVEGDPAADMHEWYGRFLYFHVDEVAVPTEEEDGSP